MVNRTPKRAIKQVEAPKYNDIYDALKSGESEITTKSDAPDVSGQLAELIKRVDQLQAENAAFRSYSQQPQQVVVQAQPQAQTPTNDDAMPDPVLDADNYAKWLLKRTEALITTRMEASQKAVAEQTSNANAYDNLWNGFLEQEGNDVWADEPEKVQVAALKVSKKLQARGIDVNRYMFGSPELFYADVVKMLEDDFGRPATEDKDNEGSDDTAATDVGEVDRTAGLMGGQVSPAVKGTGIKSNAGVPDLLGDLVSIQRKGGWY